jgi:L-ascorbate metabolism protein UlaG (beta-lactamase superfamily)
MLERMTTITWYGHAAFTIADGDTTLLIDPYLTGNPTAAIAAGDVAATAILVTHGHSDHLGDAVDISRRTGAPIVATYELGLFLGTKGVNVTPGNIGGTVTAGEATVKFVPAVHSSTMDENGSLAAASVPTGFVVRLNGTTVYVAGDTALFGDMELIGDEGLDVAIIPIGGQYTMDATDAVKAVAKLRPKTVIPGHFNTFPTIAADPAAFAEAVAAATKARVVVLQPGQSMDT